MRPKTFIGPERLGVFEILFDWIREGRRIPILGDGRNRYQLLAVEDLVDAIVLAAAAAARRRDAQRRRGRVRHRALRPPGADRPRRLGLRLAPVPARPAEIALRALELARLSPLAEWHYRTAHRDSFVDVSKAQRLLGWRRGSRTREALCRTYDWYLANREHARPRRATHRVPWNQQALALLKRVS